MAAEMLLEGELVACNESLCMSRQCRFCMNEVALCKYLRHLQDGACMGASVDDVEARDRQCELLRVSGKLGEVLVPPMFYATVPSRLAVPCRQGF